ncbi:MAG: glycosyltransferase family 39 protein [Acidimicrobiia bacterium]
MAARNRRFFARMGLVTAGAAIWRVWYAAAIVDPRVRDVRLSDQVFYTVQANLLAHGHGFSNPFAFIFFDREIPTALHPPLYSLVLALPARLGITSELSYRVITALLGAVVVFLVGMLGRQLGGDRVGIVAAILAAAYPPLWTNDAVIGLETLYCLLVVLALMAAYRFWDSPGIKPAAAMAVPLSLAVLTRSEGLVLFVLLGGSTVLLARGIDWKRKLQLLGVVAGIGVVITAPWVVRNLVTFEEPTTLGTGFGGVLAYGNCDTTYYGEKLGYWDDSCSFGDYPRNLEESVVDARARDQGLTYIRNNLDRVPVVMLARIGRIWNVFQPVQDVHLNDAFERRGLVESWAVLLAYYLLIPFAIGGLFVMRHRHLPIFPMLAIAAAVTITVVVGFPVTRYRAPFDLVIPVLAAFSLDALWRRYRAARSASSAPLVDDACSTPRSVEHVAP